MRLFKFMYRFNAISIQNSPGYFIDYDKFIVKFTWKNKKTKMTKISFLVMMEIASQVLNFITNPYM